MSKMSTDSFRERQHVRFLSPVESMSAYNRETVRVRTFRKDNKSDAASCDPLRGTTISKGRSFHMGWGTAMTAASATCGEVLNCRGTRGQLFIQVLKQNHTH